MTEASVSPIDIAYLVTGVLFILGLRYLSSPATARLGNRIALAGMVIAVGATLLDQSVVTWWVLALGFVIGGGIGLYSALKVKMTAMPQMVALFNGAGGGAAALVSTGEFLKLAQASSTLPFDQTISIMLSSIIGALSFSGSIIAFLKLQELMTGRPIT